MAILEWREFGPQAFDQAKADAKPILLVLTVPWCAHCKDLLETTLSDPRVIETISREFIPIAVDAERRPDVNDRYGTGGWPTISYLTPGADLITQDRYLTADELLPHLDQIAAEYATNRTEIEAGIRELWDRTASDTTTPRSLSEDITENVADAIYEKFDHRYGGWGTASKFPHSEAIDFALVMVAKRQDPRMQEVVKLTLDQMQSGGIHDEIDGGFFRFSRTPDWRAPNFEKILDANAQRLRCYLEAYQLFDNPEYRRTAEGIIRWMLKSMVNLETDTFCGSQDADSDYYALDAEGRSRRQPPNRNNTTYTNGNSMMVSSLLKASIVLDRPELLQRATCALNFLLENLTDGEGTVYHYWDGTYHLPGLLSDQAYLIRALIDCSQHTSNSDLLLPAEAIAEMAMNRQKSPDGGFFDILQDNSGQGSMRRRNRSILDNAVMAESLVRLSYLSRRREFYDEAIRALESFTDDYKKYGYYVAAYGRAVDLVFYPPLTVTIIGDRDSEAADALRKASLLTYVPSRIVQVLDPRHDPVLIERAGYEVGEVPRAYLTVGTTEHCIVETPDDLLVRMNEIEAERHEGL